MPFITSISLLLVISIERGIGTCLRSRSACSGAHLHTTFGATGPIADFATASAAWCLGTEIGAGSMGLAVQMPACPDARFFPSPFQPSLSLGLYHTSPWSQLRVSMGVMAHSTVVGCLLGTATSVTTSFCLHSCLYAFCFDEVICGRSGIQTCPLCQITNTFLYSFS